MQLGKIRNKRYQESKKPNSHFWRTWSKNMVSGAKVRHWTCSSHTSPRGWAKHLRPLQPDPGHTPTLALFKETAHHTPRGGSKQGNLVFVLASPSCSRGPNKALPEFQKKKKKKFSSQSRQLTLCISGDHITPEYPLEHLGHRVNFCLVHSDLKSLAANDYLCWTRVQSCYKLS